MEIYFHQYNKDCFSASIQPKNTKEEKKMKKIENDVLVATICRLTETISSLEKENRSLKRQLEETHSALVASEVRENSLIEYRKESFA